MDQPATQRRAPTRRLTPTGLIHLDKFRAGERKRIYHNYLKGSLYCGECYLERGIDDSRMFIQRAVGSNKQDYFYFFCGARQQHTCTSRHQPIDAVEEAIVDHYKTVRLQPEFIQWVNDSLDATLADPLGARRLLQSQLKQRLEQLTVKADNLVDLVAEGGLAAQRAGARLRDIEVERREVEAELGNISDDLSEAADYVRGWLELLANPYELYLQATDEIRRRLNQALFTRIWIVDLDRVETEFSQPAKALVDAQMLWQASKREETVPVFNPPPEPGREPGSTADELATLSTDDVNVWNWRSFVELRGFEPLTSSLRTKRATNCATGP